jgi:hypothetical protein
VEENSRRNCVLGVPVKRLQERRVLGRIVTVVIGRTNQQLREFLVLGSDDQRDLSGSSKDASKKKALVQGS